MTEDGTAASHHPGAGDKARRRVEWLAQAGILTEALPFMRRYNDKTLVIKYGGHAMGDARLASLFARDIVLLKQVGVDPIVVHGGGPQIGQMLNRMQKESVFVDGLRVTDQETVDIVEMVLAGSINKQIVASLQSEGGQAIGLSGKDGGLIKARKLSRTTKDPESNIEMVLDLGFVGEPYECDTTILEILRKSDFIPVIAPIGMGENGQTYNINADTAAGAIAGAAVILRECGLDFADVCTGFPQLNKRDVRHGALAALGDISLKPLVHAALVNVYGCPQAQDGAEIAQTPMPQTRD